MKWAVRKHFEGYSYLHEITFLRFFRLKALFSNNLHIPLSPCSEASVAIHTRDVDNAAPKADFSITGCQRWQVDVSQYDTFDAYLDSMKSLHHKQYRKTNRTFTESGATISRIEGDWSAYADTVYHLYEKVATKHGVKMYDKGFFQMISKQSQYKLLCAWYQGAMIGCFVLIEVSPVLHSMLSGMDYEHSKRVYAYSHLHYEFIRWAIEMKKFKIAEVGITADEAKSSLGFKPVPACIDISSTKPVARLFLRLLSRFTTATITSQSELKLSLRRKRA